MRAAERDTVHLGEHGFEALTVRDPLLVEPGVVRG
jgi:hypothetical protein